jgi:acetylornithine deacetylase
MASNDAPGGRTASDDGPRSDAALGEEAVALTSELVAIDSVNPGLVHGASGEPDIVEHLRNRLSRSGFETHIVRPPGHENRPSLVAVSPQVTPGPTVVLTGHVDTVGVEGMVEPFVPRLHGDRLEGRGACDMKGGMAAMVVAGEELARRRMPGRVVLALVADEEDESLGTLAVLEALPGLGIDADVAVIGEPTWLALAQSLRGYALVEVTLTGRAAHSSQPELGINAVTHLGRLLVAVESRGVDIAERGGSLMVTLASGGESPFVLGQGARALVERRTVPGERSESALAEVEHLLVHLRLQDDTVSSRSRLIVARDPWQLDDTGPAATLAGDLERALGDDAAPERFHAPYWMEAPLWQAAGIPTVVCGPAGGGLHAADEWVDLRQVRRYAVALTDAVTTWMESA